MKKAGCAGHTGQLASVLPLGLSLPQRLEGLHVHIGSLPCSQSGAMAQVCFEVLLMPTHTRTLVGHMCQSQARRRFINTPHVSVEKAFKLCEAGCWGYTELQQQPRDVVTPVQWVTCRTAP